MLFYKIFIKTLQIIFKRSLIKKIVHLAQKVLLLKLQLDPLNTIINYRISACNYLWNQFISLGSIQKQQSNCLWDCTNLALVREFCFNFEFLPFQKKYRFPLGVKGASMDTVVFA